VDVVVVGGGLAGLTAALDCADAGWRVTLCEARPFTGGKCYSLGAGPKAPPGTEVDNGQHVFLRCCTRFLALCARLDAMGDVALQPRLDVMVRDPDGRGWRLRANGWPAPLHMAGSLLRYGLLGIRERLALGRAALAIRRLTPERRAALDDQSFAQWLHAHGQSTRAIDRFWDLFVLATCNLPSTECSAAVACMVFQDGLLTDAHAGDIGWSRVGLSRLLPDRAVARLRGDGHTVRLRAPTAQVHVAEGRARGVTLRDGSTLAADAVVLAVPAPAVPGLLPAAVAADPFFADVPRLGASPICNVHLGFDRPVMTDDLFALTDSPVHWVFNKGRLLGHDDGAYLSCTTSSAGAATRGARDGVLDTTLATVRRALPAAREARCTWSRVVVEPDATFAARPGTQRWRRPAATPLPGLVLAGAWTDTGWPATMEGAVRSGESAARTVIGEARGAWRRGGSRGWCAGRRRQCPRGRRPPPPPHPPARVPTPSR